MKTGGYTPMDACVWYLGRKGILPEGNDDERIYYIYYPIDLGRLV